MLAFEFYMVLLLVKPYLKVHFNGLPAGIMNEHYSRDLYWAGQKFQNKFSQAPKVCELDMNDMDDMDNDKVDLSQAITRARSQTCRPRGWPAVRTVTS